MAASVGASSFQAFVKSTHEVSNNNNNNNNECDDVKNVKLNCDGGGGSGSRCVGGGGCDATPDLIRFDDLNLKQEEGKAAAPSAGTPAATETTKEHSATKTAAADGVGDLINGRFHLRPIPECHYNDVAYMLREHFHRTDALGVSTKILDHEPLTDLDNFALESLRSNLSVGAWDTVDEREHFHRTEALGVATNILDHEPLSDLDNFALESLRSNLSVGAWDTVDERWASVLLLTPVRRSDVDGGEYSSATAEPVTNPMFKLILAFIDSVESSYKGDLFEEFGVDEIWDFRMLATHTSYRGQGLAKKVTAHGLELAKKKGGRLAKSLCTGSASHRVFTSLGFRTIGEGMYADYLVDGRPLFAASGQKSSTFVIKEL